MILAHFTGGGWPIVILNGAFVKFFEASHFFQPFLQRYGKMVVTIQVYTLTLVW